MPRKGEKRTAESIVKQSNALRNYWASGDAVVKARKAALGAFASQRMKARWAEIKASSAVNDNDDLLLK